MSRNKALLDLELRLLIARHGRTEVGKALSAIGEVNLTTIESGIRTYEEKARKTTPHRRPRKNMDELVRDAGSDNPDSEHLIGKLARAYQNKEFLPELRDVKRFLESQHVQAAKYRSRATALPAVLSVLAGYGPDELRELDKGRWVRGSRSDLGIITDQILGHVNEPGKGA